LDILTEVFNLKIARFEIIKTVQTYTDTQ